MSNNFIYQIIEQDLKSSKGIVTRFAPEPNGYLHLGHIKSIVLNFDIATKYNGICHLRFDDTNPETSKKEFYLAIREDLNWLGFEHDSHIFYASSYFSRLYQVALDLINKGLAYVCDCSYKQHVSNRGTLTTPGLDSPFRNRSIEENLDKFRKMYLGKFNDGECTLRAKIDMSSGNLNMRDPVMYRIKKHVKHPLTGDTWKIYPTYDFAHALSDAFENITHSLCTLEFQDHRSLYNWFIENSGYTNLRPKQIEFSRLNIKNAITSKRNIKSMINDGKVDGYDDPRLVTIIGLRKRGYLPSTLISFCQNLGISKQESIIDISVLQNKARLDLDKVAIRKHVVLDPLLVILDDDLSLMIEVDNHPQHPELGKRKLPLGKHIYIERSDFVEQLRPGLKKLTLHGGAWLIQAGSIYCYDVIKDASGNILSLKCHYYHKDQKPSFKPGAALQWVDVKKHIKIQVNQFLQPGEKVEEQATLEQIVTKAAAVGEISLSNVQRGERFQFYRTGYFFAQETDKSDDKKVLVFNEIVNLKSHDY